MDKYDSKGPFNDPIARCTECQYIMLRENVRKSGGCPKCGCKRIRNVLALDGEEIEMLKKKNVDPDFLALFQQAEVSDD